MTQAVVQNELMIFIAPYFHNVVCYDSKYFENTNFFTQKDQLHDKLIYNKIQLIMQIFNACAVHMLFIIYNTILQHNHIIYYYGADSQNLTVSLHLWIQILALMTMHAGAIVGAMQQKGNHQGYVEIRDT